MSAIATLTKLPKYALDGLRDAAVPKKRLFGAPHDRYYEFLQENGREVGDFKWSGYVLATLLNYLLERHNIDLMTSEYSQLAIYLSEARKATYFLFTDSHKSAYLTKLSLELFPQAELQMYFNEFNGANEDKVGSAMLDGVAILQRSLEELDSDSVIVLCVG